MKDVIEKAGKGRGHADGFETRYWETESFRYSCEGCKTTSISEKGDGHGCKKVRVTGMMEKQEAVDSLIPDGCASQLRQGTVFRWRSLVF